MNLPSSFDGDLSAVIGHGMNAIHNLNSMPENGEG